MVRCFAPGCNHESDVDACSFFRFPTHEEQKQIWTRLVRRADRRPSSSSRLCSCHFPKGKEKGPLWFPWHGTPSSEAREVGSGSSDAPEKGSDFTEAREVGSGSSDPPSKVFSPEVQAIIEESEVTDAQAKLQSLDEKMQYCRQRYSAFQLSKTVIRLETGLPDKRALQALVGFVARFQDTITYYSGWRVECLSLEDQIFMTLIKLRQNYLSVHLGELFQCSTATVSNIVSTFTQTLHELLFKGVINVVPSRKKNQTSMPASFHSFQNCRMIIDCTDIKIKASSQMDKNRATYSSYRGMNSFKLLRGVAPNGVITYCSDLYPGSTSDKAIVEKSGILEHFQLGHLILADKGFLIGYFATRS
ncbi:uncharacterized protein LOC135233686 [Anguilla rostrata]|uniref:uncharacterized protein LOC135233686 n=1 Tax=Anguilla rostrata TaxID=7938 RepID=UPI0030D32EE2